jgi:hypothetical protein
MTSTPCNVDFGYQLHICFCAEEKTTQRLDRVNRSRDLLDAYKLPTQQSGVQVSTGNQTALL